MKEQVRRPIRASINGVRNRLTVNGKEPGFVYRVVNDVPGRVQELKELGYEVVKEETISVGDKRVGQPTPEGTVKTVALGGGMTGIVMRIPQDWYDEAQKEKAQVVDKSEESIKQLVRQNSDYGTVTTMKDRQS